ncbi:UDP-N-acetylmuramoyl-tripeptide--D-alanyl-D-alanine ligase [Costertonia aggregata]|uniref:UDP-N-acetylmuramoyl-tripeptide--D-alanyl-D-alanine ligase n=1 Tax=Costertonia aggregata TaxID=343403 RepID=A0A7H9ARA5_9FLAO|nr:UDP-N-acetylmuramoyl-tripeptide--D-alanyl-D-alanine ligase [Costertonia aggregata]QLG45974.1 UDP-N-acetylmuramoyl-tripeptide--D-alanyl-D-alanine ligase [Costertonia aggregata]
MTIEKLHQLFLRFPIVCTDTRKITKDCLFFALKGDNFNGNHFTKEAIEKGAAYVIIDEEEHAVANASILVKDVLRTLQELATYHRNFCSAKVVSLTGSNGKTTTKELIAAVLSKKYRTTATTGNFNNHIGVPLTLLNIKKDTEIAIIEMGANHQKEIEFLCTIAQPDFGYITNFGKAHLEGFGGVEGVIKGKSELYTFLMEHDRHIFLNADDPIQIEKLATYVKKFGYSRENNGYYNIDFVEANPFVTLKVEGTTITSNLVGSYNFTNCCAAVLLGKYFNVPITEIKNAIQNYVPQNNRSQLLRKKGHEIILDAYNANPTSMKAALENFRAIDGREKVLFLGDMFELGGLAEKEHQNIADLATGMNFTTVYLIGENFFKTNTDFKKFKSFESLSKEMTKTNLPTSKILIKGSRGMALERVLDLL